MFTLEPGIYFIPSLLKKALKDKALSKFLVHAVVEEYFEFGGARCLLPILGGLSPLRHEQPGMQEAWCACNSAVASIVAGVRLEDDLVVTHNGVRSLTNVPRKVEDVERVMAGGEWESSATDTA